MDISVNALYAVNCQQKQSPIMVSLHRPPSFSHLPAVPRPLCDALLDQNRISTLRALYVL